MHPTDGEAAVDEFWAWVAVTDSPAVAGAAIAALAHGDDVARMAVADYAAEHWGSEMLPFVVGEEVLVCTQTLYYVGRVAEVRGGCVKLEQASWVHWTGRLGTLLKTRKFTGFPRDQQSPRTEHVGEVWFSMAGYVSHYPGPWTLPEKSLP